MFRETESIELLKDIHMNKYLPQFPKFEDSSTWYQQQKLHNNNIRTPNLIELIILPFPSPNSHRVDLSPWLAIVILSTRSAVVIHWHSAFPHASMRLIIVPSTLKICRTRRRAPKTESLRDSMEIVKFGQLCMICVPRFETSDTWT